MNLLSAPNDILNAVWQVSYVTKDSPALITFTGQYGILIQFVDTDDAVQYTLSFWARRISGNTALSFFHYYSADGDLSPLTLTGTLTRYSTTKAGKSGGGYVLYGIIDPNASGFGQVEISGFYLDVQSNSTGTAALTGKRVFSWGAGSVAGLLPPPSSSGIRLLPWLRPAL